MKSSYSLIRYYNNSLSKENIVVGLIAISNSDVFYKFSQSKLNLISKIFKKDKSLIEFNLKKIESQIKTDLDSENLFFDTNSYHFKNLLERMSIYNNGMVQFDKPIVLNNKIEKEFFENFYNNYVDSNQSKKRDIKFDEIFQNRIQNDFNRPLDKSIDIDYTVSKKIIPSLFFDYKLNGIGVNGSLYSVKCIDINSSKTIDTIRKEIAELESLSVRLDLFSQGIIEHPEGNKHYLVMDEYLGTKDEYLELYDAVKDQNNQLFPYQVINSNHLSEITTDLKRNRASKFSDAI